MAHGPPRSAGPPPLRWLGWAALSIGAAVAVGLVAGDATGTAAVAAGPFRRLAGGWRSLWGWAAAPLALGLVAAGLGLVARRDPDPWRLPWLRVLGLEAAVAAALALSARAWGPFAPSEAGPAGLAGWALATAAELAVGPTLAVGGWLVVGILGVLAASRIGASSVAAFLDDAATALALPGTRPGGRSAATPGSRPAGPRSPRPVPGTQTPLWPAGAPGGPVPPRAADGEAAARSEAAASDPAAGPAAAPRKTRATPVAPADRAPATGPNPQPPGRKPAATATPAALPDEPPAARPAAGRIRPAAVGASAAAPAPARAVRGARMLPDATLLEPETTTAAPGDAADLQAAARTIEQTLAGFGAPGEVVEVEQGPTFTRFGVRPGYVERGGQRLRVKVGRISALKHDLALALAAPAIRIEAPVPGRSLVGIEVPSTRGGPVRLRGIAESQAFTRLRRRHGLALALGRDVTGAPVVADLTGMPHLLIAGATGSGKSVGLNAILASLLLGHTPDALRLILVDPKRVELSRYGALPHLVAPVVTEAREAVGALRWVVAEMDHRYQRFAARGARDRAGFNARSPAGEAPVPALVVVIDELADLMLTAPADVEPLLTRVAQLGRATGIHLIVATQRPSTDVLTGIIKANFPARIAFAVSSGIDSRVVLDRVGAEALLGRGDMLFQPPDAPHPVRLQGAWVSDAELDALVGFWRGAHWPAPPRLSPWEDLVPSDDPDAELYERARALAEHDPRLSASVVQRRLRVGFPKARQLVERLVEDGWLAGGRDGPGDERDPDADDGERPPGRGRGRTGGRGEGPGRSRDLGWVDSEFEG